MVKKILVTGAAGLLGRELCYQLTLIGHRVIGTDNNFRYPGYRPDCDYIKSELVDFLTATENDFDYIFHMSAINGTRYFYEIPNSLIKNNISSDFAVFDFTSKNPNCKLIYASSSEVIAGTQIIPTPEINDIVIDDIHNPRWSYRLGKVVAENYLVNSDLDFLIIRLFNVYGPGSGKGHFIRDILDKIKNQDFTLTGPDETRSFCRVEDAVGAVIHIFDEVSKEVVNIGSDEEITILEAATIISSKLCKSIEWKYCEGNRGSVKRRKPDLSKLYSFFPMYRPRSFKNSLADIICED